MSFDKTHFQFEGSRGDLQKALSAFMSSEDGERFISQAADILKRHPHQSDEYISERLSVSYPRTGSDKPMLYMLVGSANQTYNINITALTLISIAILLDINLTLGFASGALAILGFNNQAIAKVDVSSGEKCLILEAMYADDKVIDEYVLERFHSDCVHNDIQCRYQSDETCCINKDEIILLLEGLCKKNVFSKVGRKYKYNF